MSTISNIRIGISLSGGGYRATAFHLGTLKKLNELGVLEKADVISTISGGSITGACYATKGGAFEEFYRELYEGLQKKSVIHDLIFSWLGFRMLIIGLLLLGSFIFLFTPWPWIFPIAFTLILIVLVKFQFEILPISKRIEQVYDAFFYKGKTLSGLADKPKLVIGSTNLQTARGFLFSKELMRDTTYQFMDNPVEFKPDDFPLSRAVMASSCVPFAFTPIKIDRKYFVDESEADKVHPVLVDGGVYDNQGIHNVMQKGRFACDIVITSDAGTGNTEEGKYKNTIALILETVNVFMSRIKKSQMMRNVYDNASTVKKQVAYFSLGWDIENCIPGFIKNLRSKQITQQVIKAHKLQPDWVAEPEKFTLEITQHLKAEVKYDSILKPSAEEKKIARSVSTNLTRLSKSQVDCLIKQAEALTELQVKLYCPSAL